MQPKDMTMEELTYWTRDQFGGEWGNYKTYFNEGPEFEYLQEEWYRSWESTPFVATQGNMRIQVDYLFGDPEQKVVTHTLRYPPKSNPDSSNILSWEWAPFCFIVSKQVHENIMLMQGWGAI